MRVEQPLDGLDERFEKLVLQRSNIYSLSDAYLKQISDKFAHKSLQELQDIASRLETNLPPL